ncbi:hypothetical protein GCM10019060_10380 [Novosphingobium pokkalii]|nr:hypothetical protein GCM10019060_10380 [Novosphingobium pokkalii]
MAQRGPAIGRRIHRFLQARRSQHQWPFAGRLRLGRGERGGNYSKQDKKTKQKAAHGISASPQAVFQGIYSAALQAAGAKCKARGLRAGGLAARSGLRNSTGKV